VGVIAAVRLALPHVAALVGRTVTIIHAVGQPTADSTGAVLTALTVSVVAAADDLAAVAHQADVAGRAVLVLVALDVRDAALGERIAELARAAVRVAVAASPGAHAAPFGADPPRHAVGVLPALGPLGHAAPVVATLPGRALPVNPALWLGFADSVVAGLAHGAVPVDPAPGQAALVTADLAPAAVLVVPAAIGAAAIEAERAGRAARVVVAPPAADPRAAQLSQGAVAVGPALGGRIDADVVPADLVSGAVCVLATLHGDDHALAVVALLAGPAVGVAAALGRTRYTLPCLAELALPAVGVFDTGSRTSHTLALTAHLVGTTVSVPSAVGRPRGALPVAAHLPVWAVAVHAALRGGLNAAAVGADLAIGALLGGGALGEGHACVVDARVGRWAVGVAAALAREDALPRLAGEPGPALLIQAALSGGHAHAALAALLAVAVGVAVAVPPRRLLADPGDALQPLGALGVGATRQREGALSLHAEEPLRAVGVAGAGIGGAAATAGDERRNDAKSEGQRRQSAPAVGTHGGPPERRRCTTPHGG